MAANDSAQDKARLLEILKKEAFVKERVTLSSGKVSDFYIDARRVTLSPEGIHLVAKIVFEMIEHDRVAALGGPTLGADPIVGAVSALSFEKGKPIKGFIVRKAPKPYGKQQQVEGPLFSPGDRVILIDDVVTTGKSLVQAIDILKPLDVVVLKAICLVDRNEGGREALQAYGCQLVSVFEAADFPK